MHCVFGEYFPFTEETYLTGKEVLEHFDEAFRPVRLHTLFYYHKYSPYKNLIYLVKYHAYRRLGTYLGRMLGEKMTGSCEADRIVPIPLHKKRERKRDLIKRWKLPGNTRSIASGNFG
ncbi:MAG: hypothetical protein V8S95_00700 [Odoribacter sp.]